MVNTNEDNAAPKKRGRLFGRKSTVTPDAAAEAPAEVTPAAEVEAPVVQEPEAPAAEGDFAPVSATRTTAARRRTPAKAAADAVDADGATPEAASADSIVEKAPTRRRVTKPVVDEPAVIDDSIGSGPDMPVVSDAPKRRTPPRPTTSLLFQAPDLPPLPPLRGGARRDDDRYDDEDDRRDDSPRQDARRGSTRRDNGRATDDNQRDNSRDGQRNSRDDAQQDEETQNVRRRSRRRPGEEPREGDTDPNTVVKVRQPRQQPEPELITEPQRIKGSTRLEAKKQRRRDGRDAGRRRPVITEAEFIARRESVDRVMVVRSKFDRIQIGVLEDGVLVEHYVAKAAEASLIGNVYLGRVQNVLPSMEAAFVDIGRGRNAVLYSGEVDWDAAAAESETKNQPRRIELALKPGDRVLVQVTKDPIGHKGARLTSQVSLPGRYLVYVPNGSMSGISRKLPDTERTRLKKILKEVLPDNVGVIVRTAAEGATEEQLTLDVNRLTSQWAEISRLVETSQAPVLLHSEPDLLVKIVRDVFNEDFQKLVIAGPDAQRTIESYLRSVAPDLLDRVETYEGDTDAFDAYRITEQIEKALDRKVWLPSGGSLVIDRTEAMTVVDVNTGKFVGSGGNLEETVTKNNLESAEEIVRQLRLRDIGGIIVVDFIDMVLESNRDLVLRRLVECLSRDRTKHQVAEVTSLGLVQMTRKKLGLGLIESFSEPCEHCAGRGIIIHHDPATKHRQTPQTMPEGAGRGRGRGGKGNTNAPAAGGQRNGNGNGNGAAAPQPVAAAAATHAITEDARNALAKIAASTVHTETITVIPPEVAAAEKARTEAVASAAAESAAPAVESVQAAPVEEAVAAPRRESNRGDSNRGDSGRGDSGRGDSNREQSGRDSSRRSSSRGGAVRTGSNRTELTREELAGIALGLPLPQSTDDSFENRGAVRGDSRNEGSGRRDGGRTSRGGGRSTQPKAEPVEVVEVSVPADAAADTPVAILDIPVTKSPRNSRRISTRDAEQILDSVLDALPEPKPPGQGRSRISRRASSSGAGIITTESGE